MISALEAEYRAVPGQALGQLQGCFHRGGTGRTDRLDDHVELTRGQDCALNRVEEGALLGGEGVKGVQETARTQVLDRHLDEQRVVVSVR